MGDLRFDGKVVLVTGAGAGLGKVYAIEFAKRGAYVVVNDLGSTPGGVGKSAKVADQVVEEIQRNGGKAVANYDSVEFGAKLVQTALDNFGKIDVVINNAGILRDRSFARMTEQEWDLILKIHLKGSFSVTKAAWDHMKKQGYGRIIMTSSPSGIYGNFGQSNYSAAKMGLVGFANTLALEGQKYGIHVNTIAPTAWTRLTESLMPPSSEKELRPEYIMPLVVYLCHDSCTENGGLFDLGGGLISKLRWQRTKGAVLREIGRDMRPEDVKEHWSTITDFSEAYSLKTNTESSMKTAEAIARIQSGDNDLGSNHPIRPNVAKKHKFAPLVTTHDRNAIILYALGVGASTKRKDNLKFLFELHDEFCALPSYGVVPPFGSMMLGNVEGLEINPTQILHGEQYLEIYKPIPVEGKLTSQARIVDVLDKGSGAAIINNVETFDESGEKVFFNQFVTFVVGAGGFRGNRSSDEMKAVASPPKRAPDAVIEQKTNIDQAALYRLSGDHNPLHIDPGFAAMGGFKEPILHGLCSFGFSTRHVMEQYGNNDPKMIKAVKVRFASPVIPGQTLRTEMWKEGSRVFFRTVVAESGKACLTGAYVDLNTDAAPTSSAPKEQGPSTSLASDAFFEETAKTLTPEIVKKVNAIFQWYITTDGKVAREWEMDLSGGSGKIARGKAANPGCTITISDEDVMGVFSGTANPQQLFFSGKMKVKGNIMLAQKLEVLFKSHSKL
uniref:Peroxisomal multifunctional enzyme type 2 n=1 Tax=Phallusia mammillata TaxID=59560 RepID=A0A6F9DE89_9ASCI|nr:peroxisomal multifunctional enzyme type 2 [Phallusia mammillata]